MVDGDAMVLRITPCRMQPESERQVPTSPPTSTRGKRRFHTSNRAMLPSSTNSAFITSGIGIFTLPMPVHISTERTESAPNTAMIISRETRRLTEAWFSFPATGVFSGATLVALLLMLFSEIPQPHGVRRQALRRPGVPATASAFQSAPLTDDLSVPPGFLSVQTSV